MPVSQSATAQTSTRADHSKRDQLLDYLTTQLTAADTNEIYVKSREIATDIDLSAKQVGALLGELHNTSTPVLIEKWACSTATTWRITRSKNATDPDSQAPPA